MEQLLSAEVHPWRAGGMTTLILKGILYGASLTAFLKMYFLHCSGPFASTISSFHMETFPTVFWLIFGLFSWRNLEEF